MRQDEMKRMLDPGLAVRFFASRRWEEAAEGGRN